MRSNAVRNAIFVPTAAPCCGFGITTGPSWFILLPRPSIQSYPSQLKWHVSWRAQSPNGCDGLKERRARTRCIPRRAWRNGTKSMDTITNKASTGKSYTEATNYMTNHASCLDVHDSGTHEAQSPRGARNKYNQELRSWEQASCYIVITKNSVLKRSRSLVISWTKKNPAESELRVSKWSQLDRSMTRVSGSRGQFSKVNIIFYLQCVFRKNTANNWCSSESGKR